MGGLGWSRLFAGTCGPLERGAHAGTVLLVGSVTLWGDHTGAGCACRAASHGRVTKTGAVCGELLPMGWTHVFESVLPLTIQ